MGSQELALLLLLFLPLCSAQSTYYVTPTPDTPCPREPCYSLSEYLTGQVVPFHSAELTFIFLSGDHILEFSFPVPARLTNLNFIGDFASFPEVTSMIICSQPIGFTFPQLNRFNMSGIAYKSCGSLYDPPITLKQVLQADISYCLFQGGQNGALAVIDSTLILLENRFVNNSATTGGGVYIDRSVVNLTRNIFVDNYAEVNGSGVYIEPVHHSTVSFTENTFISNSGDGAVVFVGYSSEVSFRENEFLNNSGSNVTYGSQTQISMIYVTPTPDTPCPGEPCFNFSAVVDYLTPDAVLVFLPGNYTLETSIIFTDLNSLILAGDSSAFPQVTTSIMCSQQANFVFTSIIDELFITDIGLVSCGTSSTASVQLDQVFRASISNCIFQGGQNGALRVINSNVHLKNNAFENNTARLGAGVYIDRGVVNFTGNSFSGNYGLENGAAVFVSPGRNSTVSFSLNSFINNTGGGTIIYVDPSSEVYFGENVFVNNSVGVYTVYGSFVQNTTVYYIIPSAESSCPEEHCYTLREIIEQANRYFTSNTSLVFLPGDHNIENGLLIRDITSLTMLGSDSNFTTANLICSKPSSVAIYNVSEVYISSLAFISCGSNFIGAAISLNRVPSSEILNCKFSSNINGIGGALAIESSRVNLSGNSFANNIATSTHGGGVYMKDSTANVSGNIFINNTASGWGGGVYLQNSTVNFNRNMFTNNTASYGGGIHANSDSIVNAINNIFTRNIAGVAGGGIDIFVRVVANFIGNILDYNKAQSAGGGVSVESDNNISFTLDSFMFNAAVRTGGAIWSKDSIINITESNLTGNVAGKRGGGSYLEHGTVIFCKNVFINNSAFINGAGIYIAVYTSSIECSNNTFRNNWGDGWVLFIEDSNRTSAVLSQNSFDNNTGNLVYGSSKETPSIYHITPSPDTLCPNEPCLTISEFIDQANQYIALNTTLMFLPGTHTVKSGLLVENITSLALLGNNTSVESLPLIICDRPASFGFKYIDELLVRSLAFDSCGDGTYAAFSMKSVSSVEISDCTFKNSIGNGGAVVVINCNTLYITETVFESNSAIVGGGLYVSKSGVNFLRNTFTNNKAEFGGAGISLFYCNVTFAGTASFRSNSVSITVRQIENHDREFRRDLLTSANAVRFAGGAMRISNSEVKFLGSISIKNSNAEYGGGIMAVDSDLRFSTTVDMHENSAINGGSVCALGSSIIFVRLANFANNQAEDSGGAVYAINGSELFFEGTSNFNHNTAQNGGGLYLDHNSLCYFSATAQLLFVQNIARENGGAIYVADKLTSLSVYCAENTVPEDLRSYCFFQVQTDNLLFFLSDIQATIHFSNNTADFGGGDLYGGTIDNCILYNISICSGLCNIKSSGDVFNTMTTGELEIASVPLKVSSCEHQTSDYSQSPAIKSYPGKEFSVFVTVLGQRNGTVPTIIQTQVSDNNITIRKLEDTQKTSKVQRCSKLSFTVFSSAEFQQGGLILYTYGACSRDQNSLVIQVQMLACPPGFQLSNTTGACDCDKILQRFTETCDIETGTIFRRSGSTFWVGYENDTESLILHPHCPFDYCTEEEMNIDANSSDTQCSYNRSGVLCGECGHNLSLALGSSRCLACSNSHLALLLPFATAGIVLVLFLFALKLTVSVGTIHGLIFYANVVQVNSAIFIPPGSTNPLTLFVAWLNLDLGIETCFYEGMDAYGKTWLQFVFPIYVWALVVIIIVVSHYSSGKIARLFGRNPIAVLATLFFLSYAKLLRTIIAAFSVTYAEYQGNPHVAVWLYDGNIKYLTGKHVPLFITAFLILLLLFLPYTLLLLLGQWLQAWPKFFFFINDYRIKAFLDAYHAPYNDKHRYWTGLLLCVRCILFFTIVLSALGNAIVNLLSISSAVVGLLSLKALVLGGVYKNWYVGALETSFLLNLGILTTATYHVRYSEGNQAAVTYTLLSIAFVTFAGILIYHSYLQIRDTALGEKISTETRRLSTTRRYSREFETSEFADLVDSDTTPVNLNTTAATYSTLELSNQFRESVVKIM